jgi:glycosyltransferase involved in cell wall biosynthesis
MTDKQLNIDRASVPIVTSRFTKCCTVLMVGPDIRGQGGIGTVLRGYKTASLCENLPVVNVSTHVDGGRISKVYAALRGWFLVVYYLAKLDAPLLHIHVASRASFWRKSVVCKLAQVFQRPYIMHIHGASFVKFFREECGPIAQSMIRSTLARAALVLALSEQWRADLLTDFPRISVEVLPNAVALPDLSDRQNDGHQGQAINVLFMGRLGRRKGTYDLVHAFARVASQPPGVRLICAGDGNAASLHELAINLGIADRVEFPGWVSSAQCHELYRKASIFVLPSYAEGLPMALLEAMSWRLPVVSCPVGGIPEVVQHGRNGLLVNPGDVDGLADALNKLLVDPEYRRTLGDEARATIEHRYSLEANMSRLGAIYASFGIQSNPAA